MTIKTFTLPPLGLPVVLGRATATALAPTQQ
jgi:hypothetical protein